VVVASMILSKIIFLGKQMLLGEDTLQA